MKALCRCLLALGLFAVSAGNIQAAGYPNNMKDEDDEGSFRLESASTGVTTWQVSEPFINLWLFNQPLTYKTSYGQMGFRVAFKQRNTRPTSRAFGFGAGWESSWLSYVRYTNNGTPGPAFMPLGGERQYVADGVTKEIKSASTMTTIYNGSGGFLSFLIKNPDGSQLLYDYKLNVSANENYAFLSNEIDRNGRTNTFYYETVAGPIVRLTSVKDWDQKISIVSYNGTFTSQISQVEDPYHAKAIFVYDGSGKLTNITNVGGLNNSFVYDSQGLPTNSVTPYGTTSFRTTTNSFGGYNLGGTNEVNRSVIVTYPDLSKEMFLYRDQSTKLNPSSGTDLLPTSYSDVPTTSPLSNTFDNSAIDARNSFHWGRKQYSGLSSSFTGSLNFNNLTTGDYLLAEIKHWLRGVTDEASVRPFISLIRNGSPDGTIVGQKTWLDYAGKNPTYPGSRGSNGSPSFVAMVLPDSTTNYTFSERINIWEHPTKVISTFTPGTGGVSTRTNTFTYTSDGVDVVEARGPSNELLSSNAYNGFHQVVTNFNAANEMTTYSYDGGHRLINGTFATGLVHTNGYASDGCLTNSVDVGFGTNSFTYTNCLVLCHMDPVGFCTTNTWDALLRQTNIAQLGGSITNGYSNLELGIARDKMSNTVTYTYNNIGQLTREIDARGNATGYGYCGCGALEYVTNALGQVTQYFYNYDLQKTGVLLADGSATSNKYNLLGQLIFATDGAGNWVTNLYNNQGLLAVSSNAMGLLKQVKYDVRDRATNVVGADGVSINMTYDNLDRLLTRSFPDTGVEQFQYSAAGLIAYTNQIGKVTKYRYDSEGRKIEEVNPNNETNSFTYNATGQLLTLVDGKNQTNRWEYDTFGRVTKQFDATGTEIARFTYDVDGRMTTRWTPAKGDIVMTYDANDNLLTTSYSSSPSITFSYDALNRVTNMVDGIGTTRYAYTSTGNLQSEDGPWDNDTVTYSYTPSQLRSSMAISQPNASPWVQTYGYDSASRLNTIGGPPGVFIYDYQGASQLIKRLSLPNGTYITNAFDNVGRMTNTCLKNDLHAVINSHGYAINTAGQITRQTRTEGSYVDYTYDNAGQLKTAIGKESGGTSRLHEQMGYAYDAAGNLNYRTNNALVQSFNTDSRNQLTTGSRSGSFTAAGSSLGAANSLTVNGWTGVRYGDNTFAKDSFTLTDGNNTYTAVASDTSGRQDTQAVTAYLPANVSFAYDNNGNLTSDGYRTFQYDDENQLITVYVASAWTNRFEYDGKRRLRIRKEYKSALGSATNEVRYIYDGMLSIQERNGSNLPVTSLTRGLDLSGSTDAAGGIGGLLARRDQTITSGDHAFYHADRNGNLTCLINAGQAKVAEYLYDPYGKVLAASGPLAGVNSYQFSSKEFHIHSGLTYFGYRFYDQSFQRWLSRDPIAENGGINLYQIVHGDPVNRFDSSGLLGWGDFSYKELLQVLKMARDAYLKATDPAVRKAALDLFDAAARELARRAPAVVPVPGVPAGPSAGAAYGRAFLSGGLAGLLIGGSGIGGWALGSWINTLPNPISGGTIGGGLQDTWLYVFNGPRAWSN